MGLVRLVKVERIPRESGVLVREKLEGVLGEPGPVVIEPGALCGRGSGLSAWYVVTRNYLMCHDWDRGTQVSPSLKMQINRDSRGRKLHEEGLL